jgi:hypothetical protein
MIYCRHIIHMRLLWMVNLWLFVHHFCCHGSSKSVTDYVTFNDAQDRFQLVSKCTYPIQHNFSLCKLVFKLISCFEKLFWRFFLHYNTIIPSSSSSSSSSYYYYYYYYYYYLFIPLSLRTEHRASTVPRHPRLLFQFLGCIRHLVGLLGGEISPAQGLYLHRTT